MATDKQLNDLLKGMTDLVNLMKQKNSAASATAEMRIGRKGAANGKAVSASTNTVEALTESLQDLHRSMRSGGKSISDHFEEITKSIRPLSEAFKKLDKTVEDIAETQSKASADMAKAAGEFVKQNKGNAAEIAKLSKEMEEYYELTAKLVNLKSAEIKDTASLNDMLSKRAALEKSLSNKGMPTAVGKVIATQLENLALNKGKARVLAKTKGTEAVKELEAFSKGIVSANKAFDGFLGSIKSSMEKYNEAMSRSIKDMSRNLTKNLTTDLSNVPDMIAARLQSGVSAYNFGEAMNMGLTPAQLAQFQSSNREAINAITRFGSGGDLVSDGRLEGWASQGRRYGLTGPNAAAAVGVNMQTAYATGRGQLFDSRMNQQMMDTTASLQQTFNFKDFQAASDAMQKFSTQTYNLEKFARVNQIQDQRLRRTELTALNEEFKARFALSKALGIELDTLQQQDARAFDNQFADVGAKFKSLIFSQQAAAGFADQFGWDKGTTNAFIKFQQGAQLNNEERKLADAASKQVTASKLDRERRGNLALSSGDMSGYFSAQMEGVVSERMLAQTIGPSLQQQTVDNLQSGARQLSQGNLTAEQVQAGVAGNLGKFIASTEDASGQLELLALRAKELFTGVQGAPGVSTATGLLSGGLDLAQTAIMSRYGYKSIASVFGKGAASGLGNVAKGVGGRLLGASKGGIGGLLGGLTLGLAADAVGTDTKTGAGLDVGSRALSYAGTGALLGSVIPGVGTAVGAIGGGLLGAGLGLWDHKDTLFSGPPNAPAASGAGIGTRADAAGGIVRDSNGQPITAAPDGSMAKLVELTQQQIDIAKEGQREARDFRETTAAVAAHKQSVQEYNENLAVSMVSMFSAPTA